MLPDHDTISWHHARENYVGEQLHGSVPIVKGAIVGTKVGKRVWCYFNRVWYNPNPKDSKENTLHILRLVIEDGVDDEEFQLSNGHVVNGTATASVSMHVTNLCRSMSLTSLFQGKRKSSVHVFTVLERVRPIVKNDSAAGTLPPYPEYLLYFLSIYRG